MSTAKKKLSIVSFSGNFDKAIAFFTLATGAAAVNYEVNLFFTFWGLNLIKKKKGKSFLGNGFLSRIFGFLSGGLKKCLDEQAQFRGFSPKIMTFLMKKRNVATLKEFLMWHLFLNIRKMVKHYSFRGIYYENA